MWNVEVPRDLLRPWGAITSLGLKGKEKKYISVLEPVSPGGSASRDRAPKQEGVGKKNPLPVFLA